MTADDLCPLARWFCPPSTQEEADQRAAELVQPEPTALAFSVWKDDAQLRRALSEAGWGLDAEPFIHGPASTGLKGTIVGAKDGSKYAILLVQCGAHMLRVEVVQRLKGSRQEGR